MNIDSSLHERTMNSDHAIPVYKKKDAYNVICGNCNRQGHSLRNCVGPVTARGDIIGCPYCNTTEHIWDNCPRYNNMEVIAFPDCRRMDVFKYFFLDLRTNKPPIRTGYNLWLFVLGLPDQPRYPWSLEFSKNQASYPTSIVNIDLFYIEGEYTSHVVDPATHDIGAISRNIDFSVPIRNDASHSNLLVDACVPDQIPSTRPGSSANTQWDHIMRTSPHQSAERWRDTCAVFAASSIWTFHFNAMSQPEWARYMFRNVIKHNIAGSEFLFCFVLQSKGSW